MRFQVCKLFNSHSIATVQSIKPLSAKTVNRHWSTPLSRARATLTRRKEKESGQIEKILFHLQAKRFESKIAAESALNESTKTWKLHLTNDISLIQHKRYSKKGRPGNEKLMIR